MRKPNSAEKLAIFWVRRVSPSLTLLSATVGLGGILGSALVLWGLTLALQGLAPSSQAIDAWILQWLQRASPWLDPLAWVGWGLGHPIGLVGLTAWGWVLLWRSQQRRTAWGLLVAALGAAVIAGILQPTFSRPRPDLWDPILSEWTGHRSNGNLRPFGLSGGKLLSCSAALVRWRSAGDPILHRFQPGRLGVELAQLSAGGV